MFTKVKDKIELEKKKKLIRKYILEQLNSLNEEEVRRRSENVEKNLGSLSVYKKARCVVFYYPLKKEVNLLGIIREALKNKEVCFPVIDLVKGELIPYQVQNLDDDLVKGPWGVIQPAKEKTRRVSREELDLVVVPGLAFDKEKNRLGRGGGFYDRFLKKLSKKTKKVGVIFNFQLLEDLPFNFPQDEKVDFVVTEEDSF